MPLSLRRTELFPDDTNALPTAGSAAQDALLADELEIGNERYLEQLQQFSHVTDNIYPELVAACRNVLAVAQPGRTLRVLDLCSGVGVVSLELIRADVSIEELTLADLSPELMKRAVEILTRRGAAARVRQLDMVQVDLLVEDLRHRVPGPFDLVVTCNAFQHFPRERQAALFQQIHDILAPSGVFVFESHFKLLRPDWKQHIVAEFQARLRQHGAPEPFVEKAAVHINEFHHYANLVDGYNWLEAAGFGFYDCVFRQDVIGIFAAVK